MIRIGLTGGIGAGKSEVAKLLREHGIPVINADQVAKMLMQSDEMLRQELIEAFGADVYCRNGSLNKEKLASIIFSTDDARKKINALVHPRVLRYQQAELYRLEQAGTPFAGVEAALIYESGSDVQFHVMVVVTAPKEQIIERIKLRDRLFESQIRQRMDAQMSIEEKVHRADYVIENLGTKHALQQKVDEFCLWLRRHEM